MQRRGSRSDTPANGGPTRENDTDPTPILQAPSARKAATHHRPVTYKQALARALELVRRGVSVDGLTVYDDAEIDDLERILLDLETAPVWLAPPLVPPDAGAAIAQLELQLRALRLVQRAAADILEAHPLAPFHIGNPPPPRGAQ